MLGISLIVFVITGARESSLNVLNLSPFVIYFSNAYIGTICIFFVAMFIEKEQLLLTRIIEYYGKSMLIVMGTHQVIMLLFMIPIKTNYWLNFVYCLIILLAEIPVVYLINKIKNMRGKLNGKRNS